MAVRRHDKVLVWRMLQEGHHNARTGQTIAHHTGLKLGKLQQVIEELVRVDGVAIGSSDGTPKGYFRIMDKEDAEIALRTRGGRLKTQAAGYRALLKSTEKYRNADQRTLMDALETIEEHTDDENTDASDSPGEAATQGHEQNGDALLTNAGAAAQGW